MVKTKMGMKIAFVKSSGLPIALTVSWRFIMREILLTLTVLTYLTMGGTGLPLYCQSGILMSVSGYVRDVNTHQPMGGVEVYLFRLENNDLSEGLSGKSNQNGIYCIEGLEAGNYTFSISIPGTGNIYISKIALRAQSSFWEEEEKNIYDIEIKEARNIKLNFFLGEDSSPDIERCDIKFENEIQVIMRYISGAPLEPSGIKSFSKPESPFTCSGLDISFPEMKLVPDYEVLRDNEGKEGIALLSSQITGKASTYKCDDGECDFGEVSGQIRSTISYHSDKWYSERYSFDDNLNKCIKQCDLEHEGKHFGDLLSIGCKEWKKFKDTLDNAPISCDCSDDCAKKLLKRFNRFKRKVAQGLNAREETITNESNTCKDECVRRWNPGGGGNPG